jgi:outer membrane lipoprotein-sorting protein
MFLKILLLVLLLISSTQAQNKDPKKMLEDVKNEYEQIKDYQADIHIKVDIPFIKMPERKAVIYFKQPDKIHIESGGFAILPKEGIKFSPLTMLESDYTALYEREESVGNIIAAVVKIIPLNSESDLLLSTLWIDPVQNRILKIESSRKPSGNFIIELSYGSETEYNLPELISFTFSADPTLLQPQSHNQTGLDTEEASKDSAKTKPGKVLIHYSNYKVNMGIPDSIFQKEK